MASPFVAHQLAVMDELWPHVVRHALQSDDPEVVGWARGEWTRLEACGGSRSSRDAVRTASELGASQDA